MGGLRPRLSTVACLAVCLCGPAAAQQGAVAGRVSDASTLAPVASARIRVVGGGPSISIPSESDGTFELSLPPGVYDLVVEAPEFAPARFDGVRITAGRITRRDFPLESRGFRLAGFIVTASRGTVDTEITAPSSSHVVREQEISERPASAPVEHLRESPGVDIGTQGIQSSNVVVRGFNNIFSGALHLLTDYRLAGLPSLRANFLHFLPLNDHDIERIEVVLGPGSALYGPNTANGVVHVITRSPLDEQGTTVSLGGGERSLLQGYFRSAVRVTDGFGFKVSGQFLQADEWPYEDPTEIAARERALAEFPLCVADRQLRGAGRIEAEIACRRIGQRNDRIRRQGLDARADWRFSRRGVLVTGAGVTDVTGIELTGLGAAQVEHWLYQYVQARLSYDRWTVHAYLNANDSGDAFFVRDGLSLRDHSMLGVVQIQNGFDLFGGRQDVTYGFDYFSDRPDSRGTIYGDFEDENDITSWGVYLQSRTAVASTVDLIAAGRVDGHSILPERVFSPRLALILKPRPGHALRFAYNRAFSTPTALNFFLDLGAGFALEPFGSLAYTSRAFGSGRNGFAWQNADGSLRGMRSPFNPDGPGELLPVDPATLWGLGLGAAHDRSPLPPDVLAVLRGLAPGPMDVDILYLDLNEADPTDPEGSLRPLSGLTLPDVPPIRESDTESFEVGWSGVFSDALRVSLDVYYRRQHDLVSPLVVETPLLYLDGPGLRRWLTAAYVPARVQDLVDRLGFSLAAATAQADAEAAGLVPGLAGGIARLPLGVTASDVPQMANGGADLIATYRNVGDLDLWGADATLEWLIGPRWTVTATWSHVSRNWFRIAGGAPLALNAPADKGTLALRFRDEGLGMASSVRVRHTGAFPFVSTDYVGTLCVDDAPGAAFREDCIEAATLVDLTWGYKIPASAATLQVGVSNLFNTGYRSMVGVPTLGRLVMARLEYAFR